MDPLEVDFGDEGVAPEEEAPAVQPAAPGAEDVPEAPEHPAAAPPAAPAPPPKPARRHKLPTPIQYIAPDVNPYVLSRETLVDVEDITFDFTAKLGQARPLSLELTKTRHLDLLLNPPDEILPAKLWEQRAGVLPHLPFLTQWRALARHFICPPP